MKILLISPKRTRFHGRKFVYFPVIACGKHFFNHTSQSLLKLRRVLSIFACETRPSWIYGENSAFWAHRNLQEDRSGKPEDRHVTCGVSAYLMRSFWTSAVAFLCYSLYKLILLWYILLLCCGPSISFSEEAVIIPAAEQRFQHDFLDLLM